MITEQILSFFARTFDGSPVMVDGEPLAVELRIPVAGRNARMRRYHMGACIANFAANNPLLRFIFDNHCSTFAVIGGDIRGELRLVFSGECAEVDGCSTKPICVPREHADVGYAASLYPVRREREHIGGGFFKDVE